MTSSTEIHRGEGGYTMMRLETYDLPSEAWSDIVRAGLHVIAKSMRPDGSQVETFVTATDQFAVHVSTPDGRLDMSKEDKFPSATAAMRYHELLAEDITERIDLLEQLRACLPGNSWWL